MTKINEMFGFYQNFENRISEFFVVNHSKTYFRTHENPIHYKVQIASGDRVPTIQKDETVEIRLNGRNQVRFSHWST